MESALRFPNRFLGLRNLPYLKAGIREFKAKRGQDSGLKVCSGCRCPITFEITGVGKNYDRDDGIEGPIGDPSINDTLSSKAGV